MIFPRIQLKCSPKFQKQVERVREGWTRHYEPLL